MASDCVPNQCLMASLYQVKPWGGALMLDVHWYLNWAGDFKAGGDESPDKSARAWDKIHFRACHSPANTWDWCSKSGNDVPVMLGEWSLATNHDAPLDLSDATTARELRQMYAEQLGVYTFGKAWANQSAGRASGGPLLLDAPNGIRMGSATNDRASARAPRQRELRRPEPRGLPLPGLVTSRARSARYCLLDERGEERDLRGRGQALVRGARSFV